MASVAHKPAPWWLQSDHKDNELERLRSLNAEMLQALHRISQNAIDQFAIDVALAAIAKAESHHG